MLLLIKLVAKVAMIALATMLYVKGETDTKFLGKCNKNWKLTLGIPIGLIGALLLWSWVPLLCLVTYIISGEMPYGDNHWWTKLWGKRNAIAICGASMGLASYPILGLWSFLAALLAGILWYWLAIQDDAGKIKEPFVAIIRALTGTMLLLLA